MLDKSWSQWTATDSKNPGYVTDYKRVEEAAHPDSQQLICFWRSCNASDGFVVGRDIPSRPLASLLRSLMVNEPIEGGADYRIRLAGSALRRRYGREITSLRLSALFSPEAFVPHPVITKEALATDSPRILDVREQEFGQLRHHREVVVVPVLSPDRTAKWVLAGVFYFD
jgi:hypothetical protein